MLTAALTWNHHVAAVAAAAVWPAGAVKLAAAPLLAVAWLVHSQHPLHRSLHQDRSGDTNVVIADAKQWFLNLPVSGDCLLMNAV